MLNPPAWMAVGIRVLLPAGVALFLLAVAAAGLASALKVGAAMAVFLVVIGCGCAALALRSWRALSPDAWPAGQAAVSRNTGLAAADWERALLGRLPGLSLLVQEVSDGTLTDWLVLAGSGQEPADTRPGSVELLSHWLSRHPQFRPAEVVAALQGTSAPVGDGSARWAVLPLGAQAHKVLWLAPEKAAPMTALPAPAAPPENERESIAYTVSHDLRAPIRVIEGFTRIVREDYGHLLDRIGNDHLDRVLGAASRMNGMIDALLALSRLSTQPLAREPVALSTLAAQIVDELRVQAPARQVEVVIEPGLSVQGDPALLRCVLENLLGNAWKYTARRAESRIEFGATRLSRLRPDVGEAQDRTVYFVADNGAGFDMRFAERLFSAFQRLHSASEFSGTGVGLASVRRIVSRHGGQIWAQAAVDQGATFYFTLP